MYAIRSYYVIKNDLSDKVLTYEFGGSINGKDYRIYINAENGTEENIEEIRSNKPTNKTDNHQNLPKHKKQA